MSFVRKFCIYYYHLLAWKTNEPETQICCKGPAVELEFGC